jgi:hypothetical protein
MGNIDRTRIEMMRQCDLQSKVPHHYKGEVHPDKLAAEVQVCILADLTQGQLR